MEDDDVLRRILRLTLRRAGFATTDVGTGEEAMDVLGRSAPDAVVLDLGLPNGRGKAVLERVTRLQGPGEQAPCLVVISALNREDAVERYGPLKAPFLGKPFDPWELVRLFKGFLAKRP